MAQNQTRREGEGRRKAHSAALLQHRFRVPADQPETTGLNDQSQPHAHPGQALPSEAGAGPGAGPRGGAGPVRGGAGAGLGGATRPGARGSRSPGPEPARGRPAARSETGGGEQAPDGVGRYLRWKSWAKGFRYGSISRSLASSGTSARAAARASSEPWAGAGAAIFRRSPSSRGPSGSSGARGQREGGAEPRRRGRRGGPGPFIARERPPAPGPPAGGRSGTRGSGEARPGG